MDKSRRDFLKVIGLVAATSCVKPVKTLETFAQESSLPIAGIDREREIEILMQRFPLYGNPALGELKQQYALFVSGLQRGESYRHLLGRARSSLDLIIQKHRAENRGRTMRSIRAHFIPYQVPPAGDFMEQFRRQRRFDEEKETYLREALRNMPDFDEDRFNKAAEEYKRDSRHSFGRRDFPDFLDKHQEFVVHSIEECISAIDEYVSRVEHEFNEKSKTFPDISEYVERQERILAEIQRIAAEQFGISKAQPNLKFIKRHGLDKSKEIMQLHEQYQTNQAEAKEKAKGVLTFDTVEKLIPLETVSSFITAYSNDPGVKEYAGSILGRLFRLYKEVSKYGLGFCKLGIDGLKDSHYAIFPDGLKDRHHALFPVAAIIRAFGQEMWPQIQEMDIIRYATDTYRVLNQDRTNINILTYGRESVGWDESIRSDPMRPEYREVLYRDGLTQVQHYYYNGGEEALCETLLALSFAEGKQRKVLKEMRRQGTIGEIMKKISTKGWNHTPFTSSRATTQEFIEQLSWIYGAKLIPLLKEANLDLDWNSVDTHELRRRGFVEEDMDRKTQYGNGLQWLVENFDQSQGSFWQTNRIKWAAGDYLFWTFYNIFRTASIEQKKELFGLMDKTGFERKYSKIRDRLKKIEEPSKLAMLDEINAQYREYKSGLAE